MLPIDLPAKSENGLEKLNAWLRSNRFGGVFTPTGEHEFPFKFILDNLQDWIDRERSNICGTRVASINRSLNPITFAYARADALNALAHRIDDRFYIVICRGALVFLYRVFMRLMADPEVFPQLGDVSKESAGRGPGPLPIFAPDALDADSIAPFDQTRQRIAGIMFSYAVKFLAYHEFRHIIAGHVDYGMSRFSPSYLEDPMFPTEATGFASADQGVTEAFLNKQASEVDCDMFAAFMLVFGIFSGHKAGDAHPFDELKSPWGGVATEFVLAATASLCINKCLGVTSLDDSQWRFQWYPPVEVRRMAFQSDLGRALVAVGQEDLVKREDLIKASREAVDVSLPKVLGFGLPSNKWEQMILPGGAFETYRDLLYQQRLAFNAYLRSHYSYVS